jgi:photosystem II stability/assembly factor-like uncharacterized protein
MFRKFLTIYLATLLSQITLSQQGWYQLNSGTSQSFGSVHFTSAYTGYVSGESGRILKTTNGGLNWVTQTSGTTVGLGSICFTNDSTGYILGGANNYCLILKTTNGGLNWVQQYTGTTPLGSIYFVDLNTGYGVGAYTFAKTTNAGLNWHFQSSNIYGLSNIHFTDSNTGYVCGTDGRIMKTVNGGFSWTNLVSGTTLYLYSISFPNATTGYIAGGGLIFPNFWHIILKTTNSGNTWTNQMFSGSPLYTIFFNNTDTGYAAGEYGRILKTTNGGVNWISQVSSTGSYLTEMFFYDINIGYCVGGYGVILKTTNGGVTGLMPVGNEIPKEYKLYQNYPNPFNPLTKIKFQLKDAGLAQLVIYDILGKEVAALVNEALKPGTYEIDFDGSNYTSGIYYYKFMSGDYSETKKLVLIK